PVEKRKLIIDLEMVSAKSHRSTSAPRRAHVHDGPGHGHYVNTILEVTFVLVMCLDQLNR
ncbi:MAG: hypothetical protein QGI87_01830, partial [Candidatus Bathyarchaeota archaeon]|nr:hypothetical protein [Candidatus Bathyarchaeota archaeon]